MLNEKIYGVLEPILENCDLFRSFHTYTFDNITVQNRSIEHSLANQINRLSREHQEQLELESNKANATML